MSALNILIVGAGVAGPALALLLQRADPDHTITIVERWPSLRAAGQQIDLRAGGLRILGRMGLLDAVRARRVAETGLAFVDARGRSLGRFGVRAADPTAVEGQRDRRALTNEYEIMRGELVEVLYEASLAQDAEVRRRKEGGASGSSEGSSSQGGLTYEFGLTIADLSQEAVSDGVDVAFSDGRRRRFDLVVAADGMGSRTRRLAFGRAASDAAFRSLGIHAAYYDVPSGHDKEEEEEEETAAKGDSAGGGGTDENAAAAAAATAAIEKGLAKAYIAPGKRLVMTRRSGRPRTQVLLFKMGAGGAGADALRRSYGADGSAAGAGEEEEPKGQRQKEAFAEAFRGAGWETDRLLAGMAATEDFYAFEAGQIRMGRSGLSRGRVVLLGDAGYCPCPLTGMGTECCLVGAYVLAGELARRRRQRAAPPEEGEDAAGGDGYGVTEALARYEEVVKPIVEDLQRLPDGLSYMFPSSRVGVWILNQLVWIAAKLDQILYRPGAQADKPVGKQAKKAPKGGLGEKMDYGLAEYPELNLDS